MGARMNRMVNHSSWQLETCPFINNSITHAPSQTQQQPSVCLCWIDSKFHLPTSSSYFFL